MKLRSLFVALFFAFVLFGLYFSMKLLYRHDSLNLLEYVPDDAQSVIEINSRSIIEESLISVLIASKDAETIEKIGELIKKEVYKKAGKGKGISINPMAECVFFTVTRSGIVYNGVVYEINNIRSFDRQIKKLNPKKKYAWRNDKVGVIISSSNKNINIENTAKSLISEVKKHNSTTSFTNDGLIKFKFKNQKLINDKLYDELKMELNAEDNTLDLKGEIVGLEIEKKELTKKIKPKNLHFSFAQVPKDLNDTIIGLVKSIGLNIPKISSFSMNFNGSKLFLMNSSFLFYPETEILLNFEENFSIDSLKNNDQFLQNVGITFNGQYFIIESEKLYLKQISENSIYLGSNPHPEFISSNNNIVEISGDLTRLTNLEASFLIGAAIQSRPEFQALKSFAESSKHVQIYITPSQNNKAILKGEILFNEGKSSLNELIKLILKSGI